MTIVEDSCGRHDTLAGCCSAGANLKRHGKRDTPSCRANFLALLRENGLDARDLVMDMNFFMNVPVRPDGAMAIESGWSKPGDQVDLRAGWTCSACPRTDRRSTIRATASNRRRSGSFTTAQTAAEPRPRRRSRVSPDG